MATTTPRTWEGTPILTDEIVATIKQLYEENLADEDKAGDVDDGCWYWGYRSACEEILDMLYRVED